MVGEWVVGVCDTVSDVFVFGEYSLFGRGNARTQGIIGYSHSLYAFFMTFLCLFYALMLLFCFFL